jgi:hypothetical protein
MANKPRAPPRNLRFLRTVWRIKIRAKEAIAVVNPGALRNPMAGRKAKKAPIRGLTTIARRTGQLQAVVVYAAKYAPMAIV